MQGHFGAINLACLNGIERKFSCEHSFMHMQILWGKS